MEERVERREWMQERAEAPEEAADHAECVAGAAGEEVRPQEGSRTWEFRRGSLPLPMGDPKGPWSSGGSGKPDS